MAVSNERAREGRVTAPREPARAADAGMCFLWVRMWMWRDRSAGAEALKAVQARVFVWRAGDWDAGGVAFASLRISTVLIDMFLLFPLLCWRRFAFLGDIEGCIPCLGVRVFQAPSLVDTPRRLGAEECVLTEDSDGIQACQTSDIIAPPMM
ncbi:hypothetical protein CEP52_004658 [Fusarium oligoseptatum]|uniref:Uncharacterized protein n=1 Tax=Fusarium oligoseptatum TaxID=2604345 RepID=A0A428U2G9_9HYPO|nr:hypothetical protein CEP52_004658 [Fusarium oligoseptatum]